MKNRFFVFCLAAALILPVITGCSAQGAERKLESAGRAVESRAESIGETIKQAAETRNAPAAEPAITLDEAKEIALKHAGFTADQVTALHAEYEIEHGIPQYDVEFHHQHWEYDYEINADTGEILSFSKDD